MKRSWRVLLVLLLGAGLALNGFSVVYGQEATEEKEDKEVFTLEEIVNGIKEEIDFLVVDFQNVPERHRSLRVVLEQSLRLLGGKERDIFLRLCVFRGGFTRQAAQQVAGADMRTLAALVNKSLLVHDRAQGNARRSLHLV